VNPWPGFKPGFKPATTPFAHDNTFLCSFSFSDGYVATRYSIFDFSFSADRRGKFLSTTTSSASAFFLSRQALLLSSNRDAGEVFFCFTRPDIARYPRCFVSSFSLFLSLFSLLSSAFLSLFLFQLEVLCFFFSLRGEDASIRYEGHASTRPQHKQDAKPTNTQKYITQKLQRRQYAGFMLFLPSNQFSLSLSPSSCTLFFFLTKIIVVVIINNTKREVRNVFLSIKHTIYESVHHNETKKEVKGNCKYPVDSSRTLVANNAKYSRKVSLSSQPSICLSIFVFTFFQLNLLISKSSTEGSPGCNCGGPSRPME
jgi:hypothetical protein